MAWRLAAPVEVRSPITVAGQPRIPTGFPVRAPDTLPEAPRRSAARRLGAPAARGPMGAGSVPTMSDRPTVPRPTRAASVVVLNTGDGKGKSSSAFGVMGRGWARGWRVAVVQFVKGGDWHTGEQKLAEHLGVEWHTLGDGFTWESTDLDETAAKARHAWGVAADKLASGVYQLVILDELTYAVSFGWVPVGEIVEAVRARAPRTNVVITGRDAAPELVELADTVTEMRMVKHAYDAGIRAIRGIEY